MPMKKEKQALFPLHKASQYTVFCTVMVVILLISFLLAIRLGSVEMEFSTM